MYINSCLKHTTYRHTIWVIWPNKFRTCLSYMNNISKCIYYLYNNSSVLPRLPLQPCYNFAVQWITMDLGNLAICKSRLSVIYIYACCQSELNKCITHFELSASAISRYSFSQLLLTRSRVNLTLQELM